MRNRTPRAAIGGAPLWLLALIAAMATLGCGRLQPVPVQVTATHAQDPLAVRSAVIRALAHQRFDPEMEVPGQVYASLSNRKWMIRVAVHYAPSRYSIEYVTSAGLPQRVDRSGRRFIHRRYHRVVADLRRQIHRELGPASSLPMRPVPPNGTTTTVTTTTTTTTPVPPVAVESTQDVLIELPASQKPGNAD